MIFAVAIPCTLLWVVNRGRISRQTWISEKLAYLSKTEMLEQATNLTLLVIIGTFWTGILIAAGIALSFVFGAFPFLIFKEFKFFLKVNYASVDFKDKSGFLYWGLPLVIELTQIILTIVIFYWSKTLFQLIKMLVYISCLNR